MPVARAGMPWLKAAHSALPAGATAVGGGLLVLGITSYGFLSVAGHALAPAAFSRLALLYVLVYAVGPGLFLPLEQEIGRSVAERRVHGLGTGPLLRRAALAGVAMLASVLLALVVASPVLIHRLFDGSTALMLALLLSVAGMWSAHLSRGAFAGTGRFGSYGAQLAIEGTARLAGCIILLMLGVRSAGPYALLMGAAFLVSVALPAKNLPSLRTAGPPAHWNELTATLGWLVTGSVLSQSLVNAAPVAVKLLATSREQAAAGSLVAGLVLARLPLFLFAAVQAALLPRLAALVGRGERTAFVGGIRRLLLLVLALGVITSSALAVAGPVAMSILFRSEHSLGRVDLVLLSAGTAAFMAATVASSGLLAMRRFAASAFGWAVGALAFAGTLTLPAGLLPRVEHAFLIGALAAAVAALLAVRAALAHPLPDGLALVATTELRGAP